MPEKKVQQLNGAELRSKAEKLLIELDPPESHIDRREDETQRLHHELQVYQIELEMQNAELRHAREEMETLLENYTELYDYAPVGYITLDNIGKIRTANLTVSGILGVVRSQLTGRRFVNFVAESSRPVFSTFFGKLFAGRAKESCELALMKDGNSTIIVQIEAMTATSGVECRIALIDITERKRMEELENSNQALEAFNYMASHNLCQPLNNVYASAQAIEMLCGDKLDEESNKFLQIIKRGSMNMRNLIGTFLRFSQSEHAELRRKSVDLSDMARIVTAGLRLTDSGRQVTFKIIEGLKANGDPDLLRVVLENLLGNAWKYTKNMELAIIEFGTMELDGVLTFFIRDNGPGFDMEEAEGLFMPFKRLPGSEKIVGNGIGLATVDRIIRRHGGKIWALGEPGKGGTFFFTLGE